MKEKPIAFYAEIARELGSINAAIFYQQIRYWSDKGSREDGWIYKTAEEIEKETTLTENMQRICKRILVEEKKWLEVKKMKVKGAPTWHYRLLVDFSFELFRTVKSTVPTLKNHSSEPAKITVPLYRDYTETTTTSEREKNSRPRRLETLSESLPNTALGKVPEITHRPPMEIKEEKRLERKLSGMYDQTFGSKSIRIVKHFCARYLEKYGRVYGTIVKVDMVAKNLSTYFREGETEESLKRMIDAYFESEKANGALPVKLTTAFSDDTYRAWTQGKLGPEDGSAESVYPMNIDGLVVRNDDELMEHYRQGIMVETSPGNGRWVLTAKGKEVMRHG